MDNAYVRWTDVDEGSINSAQMNVNRNGLQHRIDILQVETDGPIFASLLMDPNAL
jgi:23S rRNA A1618 N6-methylase RlmF